MQEMQLKESIHFLYDVGGVRILYKKYLQNHFKQANTSYIVKI